MVKWPFSRRNGNKARSQTGPPATAPVAANSSETRENTTTREKPAAIELSATERDALRQSPQEHLQGNLLLHRRSEAPTLPEHRTRPHSYATGSHSIDALSTFQTTGVNDSGSMPIGRGMLSPGQRSTVHETQHLERACTDDRTTRRSETRPTTLATAEAMLATAQGGSDKVGKPSPQLKGPISEEEQSPTIHDTRGRMPASTSQTKPSLLPSPNVVPRQSNIHGDTCTGKQTSRKESTATPNINALAPGYPSYGRPTASMSQPVSLRVSSSDVAHSGPRRQGKTQSSIMPSNSQPQRQPESGPEDKRPVRQGSVSGRGLDGLRRSKSEKASKTTQVLRRRPREKAVDVSTQDRTTVNAKSPKTGLKPQKQARQGPSKEYIKPALHTPDSHFMTIGAFSALTPRPNFRYTDPPPVTRSSVTCRPANPNDRTRDYPHPGMGKTATGSRVRTSERSVDDLSSASIRYLMEKQSKRSTVSHPTTATADTRITSKAGNRTDGPRKPSELARERLENKENATDRALMYQSPSYPQAPERSGRQLQARKPSLLEDDIFGDVDKSTLPARTPSNKYRSSFRPSVGLEVSKHRQDQSVKHPSTMSSVAAPLVSSYPAHQQGFFSPVPRSLSDDPHCKSSKPLASMFTTGWTSLVRRSSRRAKGLQDRQQVKVSSETEIPSPKPQPGEISSPTLNLHVKGQESKPEGGKTGMLRSKSARVPGRAGRGKGVISPYSSSNMDEGPSLPFFGTRPRLNTAGLMGTASGSIGNASTATTLSPVTQNHSANWGTSTTTATTMSDTEAPAQKSQQRRDVPVAEVDQKDRDIEGSTIGSISRKLSRRRGIISPSSPRPTDEEDEQQPPPLQASTTPSVVETSSVQNSNVDLSATEPTGPSASGDATTKEGNDDRTDIPAHMRDIMPTMLSEDESDDPEIEDPASAGIDVYHGHDDDGAMLYRVRTTPARKGVVVQVAKELQLNAVEPEIVNGDENA